jgi:hypothetical protein
MHPGTIGARLSTHPGACRIQLSGGISKHHQLKDIHRYSPQYSARLSVHPNDLLVNLMAQLDNGRLRRLLQNDLPTRFIVEYFSLSHSHKPKQAKYLSVIEERY